MIKTLDSDLDFLDRLFSHYQLNQQGEVINPTTIAKRKSGHLIEFVSTYRYMYKLVVGLMDSTFTSTRMMTKTQMQFTRQKPI